MTPQGLDRALSSTDTAVAVGQASPVPLPNDILVNIASHLSRADVLACAGVSRRYLEVFGPVRWKRLSFDKVKDRGMESRFASETAPSTIQTQIRSYVQALDVRQRVDTEDPLIRTIGSTFHGIRLITIREYSDRPATNLANSICRHLPAGRDVKVVFFRVDTPAPASSGNGFSSRHHCRMNSAHPLPDNVTEAVLHFTAPRDAPSPKEWVCHPHTSIFARTSRLRCLTMIFDPHTAGNLRHIHYPNWRHRPDRAGGHTIPSFFHLDPNVPDPSPRGQLKRQKYGHNFAYALAVACLSVPDDCNIVLANFDQVPVPFNSSPRAASSTQVFCRSKCGHIITYTAGEPRTRHPGPAAVESYEAQLAVRMNRFADTIRRWIARLLQDECEDCESRAMSKWRNIRFITLAQYMAERPTRGEWETAPGVEVWL